MSVEFKLDKQHEINFFHHLNELRCEGLFCDVRIDVNGKIFPCHRLVLAAISPYFRAMLNGNFRESESDIITLNDFDTEAFEEILNAVYTAVVQLHPTNAYFILKASHLLQLDSIEDACVSYIRKYPEISYLIDTCLFAQQINRLELYYGLINVISQDISNPESTDGLKKIPINVLKTILCNRTSLDSEEEAAFLLISKWSAYNKASRNDVKMLLELANLNSTKYIRPIVMAELIIKSYDSCATETSPEIAENLVEEVELDNNFVIDLYLNVEDVKTDQKGWGVLKMTEGFDNFVLSAVHYDDTSDADYRKVCKIGLKQFCFEIIEDVNVFSCYNNDANNRTELKLPPCHFHSYEMVALNNSIYMVETSKATNQIWIYDCVLDAWEKKFVYFPFGENYLNSASVKVFSSFGFMDSVLYMIAGKESDTYKYIYSLSNSSPIGRLVTKFESNNHVNAAVCAFDQKIALSGSKHNDILHNTFSIFDLVSNRWMDNLKQMNVGRANHNLIHHKGFVYAVENESSFVLNEKYNLSSNNWINIPSLPMRVSMENNDCVTLVSTGQIFGIDV